MSKGLARIDILYRDQDKNYSAQLPMPLAPCPLHRKLVFLSLANEYGRAQFASAGGKWKDKEEGLRKFSALLVKRPDLQWEIHPKEIIVNQSWEVAYETGSWVEWWQEPDGLAKITGTYFLMWKKSKLEPWLIHAAIFTPLSCSGESAYCKPHEGR